MFIEFNNGLINSDYIVSVEGNRWEDAYVIEIYDSSGVTHTECFYYKNEEESLESNKKFEKRYAEVKEELKKTNEFKGLD